MYSTLNCMCCDINTMLACIFFVSPSNTKMTSFEDSSKVFIPCVMNRQVTMLIGKRGYSAQNSRAGDER